MKITDIQTFLEDVIVHYPSTGNAAPPPMAEYTYFRAREQRAAWLQSDRPCRTDDFV